MPCGLPAGRTALLKAARKSACVLVLHCRRFVQPLRRPPCTFLCDSGARKAAPSSSPPAGILKAGWLRKHRTSRPAVAALLVDRESGQRLGCCLFRLPCITKRLAGFLGRLPGLAHKAPAG